MALDPRDVSWQWASAKGWALERIGSTITVRDGSDYVTAEMDFCYTQQAPVRFAPEEAEIEKSTFHAVVAFCGLSSTAMRWWLKSGAQEREHF
jgi:hypothetical protein